MLRLEAIEIRCGEEGGGGGRRREGGNKRDEKTRK
jgi:hypothetical protein